MSDATTRHMIDAYYNNAPPPVMFLSGFFQSPPRNFYTSKEVEIDIRRYTEQVAIVVQDMSLGYRMNSVGLLTNKKFTAPVYQEAIPLDSFSLLDRMAGQNPFESPNFRANLISRIYEGIQEIDAKIRRSIELQAAQILQSGAVTLNNEQGTALFELNFAPKATHFPIASTAWNAANNAADPLGDIDSVARLIRSDGLVKPDQLLMGMRAFEAFIRHADVQQTRLNNDLRLDLGRITPEVRGEGGTYQGNVQIGHYVYSIWTYDGQYNDPQTGVATEYINPASCIVRASQARLDATFGAIPNIGRILGTSVMNLIPDLPRRLDSSSRSMDMHLNVWVTQDGGQLVAGIGSRPLLYPTAIDSFGCIATGV